MTPLEPTLWYGVGYSVALFAPLGGYKNGTLNELGSLRREERPNQEWKKIQQLIITITAVNLDLTQLHFKQLEWYTMLKTIKHVWLSKVVLIN